MSKKNNATLIVEYVKLRERLSQLYDEVAAVDQQLIELEKMLPEDYVYPGDLPTHWQRWPGPKKGRSS